MNESGRNFGGRHLFIGKLEPNAARWPTNERTENPEPNRDANDAPVSVHKNKRDNKLNQIVLLYFSLEVFPMLPTHFVEGKCKFEMVQLKLKLFEFISFVKSDRSL